MENVLHDPAFLASITEQLQRDESERLKPYDDATGKELRPGDVLKGKITIGIGRNLTDEGISKIESEGMLRQDLADKENEILHSPLGLMYAGLDSARAGVIFNMTFNLGISGLLKFNTFIGLMQQGKYNEAADDLIGTKWAKQVGPRATRLETQLRTGVWQ